jgi:LmbE family N-acetylglucosaminyl deacetylase
MNLRSRYRLRFAITPVFSFFLALCVSAEPPGKTLIVAAHPDDEYYCAATVYRMAVQLGGSVDELIITDGEGGFRYSTLAEPYYGKSLTTEAVGRKELPAIRREEAINSGKVLGIRKHFFLGQKDDNFTLDANDGPQRSWDPAFITARITALLRTEHYKYIFSLLPRSSTHGHHQAATTLAAIAIQNLPQNLRPVLLGFDTDSVEFVPSSNISKTQRWGTKYSYVFDRTIKFGFQNALSYQIVVNWMIAEHKSQGLFQTMDNKDPKEYVWIDLTSASNAQSAANSLFQLLDTNLVRNDEFK